MRRSFTPTPRNVSNFIDVAASAPRPSGPTDYELLSQAREILMLVASAESQQEMWVAQEQADTFLKLWGDGKDAPVGLLKA